MNPREISSIFVLINVMEEETRKYFLEQENLQKSGSSLIRLEINNLHGKIVKVCLKLRRYNSVCAMFYWKFQSNNFEFLINF